MHVRKRNGGLEEVCTQQIADRLRSLSPLGLDDADVETIVTRVSAGLADEVTTKQIDDMCVEVCASLGTRGRGFLKLAARIGISNLHKSVQPTFSAACKRLLAHGQLATNLWSDLSHLDDVICWDRDYEFDFFAFTTLSRSYLLRIDGNIEETPQFLWMRSAVAVHAPDWERVIQCYNRMSLGYYTHATPTLFNAGTPTPQLSSCFLVMTRDDSIEGIFETLTQCAHISKFAGGIGLHVHNVRARGAKIRGSGEASGLVPMLRVYNEVARYVDQGGGKRKGAIAVYLEMWHADIMDFVELRANQGANERRCRDLFPALWVADEFMRRVQRDESWSLFSPDQAPGLSDCWGEEFEALYAQYEKEGRAMRTVQARELFQAVVVSQIETGTPFFLFKDSVNRKSNQKHLGTIKSSNLCTEIVEYTSPGETAVCNLASIGLPRFVVASDGGALEGSLDAASRSFDFEGLRKVVAEVVRGLDRVIDRTFYPSPEARVSNLKHRPIGVGVQGLADVFALLSMPFDSPEARALNKRIFEVIYLSAIATSAELAKELGRHESYAGSPVSEGLLQPDLWGVVCDSEEWAEVRSLVRAHGLRNSLLVAPMPTASTSQILGNNECFEPFTSMLYVRRTLTGEHIVPNKHLEADLKALGLWDSAMHAQLVAKKGSVQNIEGIPDTLKQLYRTSYEIRQMALLEMAADRGAYVCQSQSLNLFLAEPTIKKVSSLLMKSWTLGLKTGAYYVRTLASYSADAVTAEVEAAKPAPLVCTRGGGDCEACSA